MLEAALNLVDIFQRITIVAFIPVKYDVLNGLKLSRAFSEEELIDNWLLNNYDFEYRKLRVRNN
ncbi:MAG: hypothetical protein QXV46_05525 [Candidatus Bathyarchaeia archaeon]